jgi:uncharacterized RDD family membrane protein YckC
VKPAPLAARAAAVFIDSVITFFGLGFALSLVGGGGSGSSGELGFRVEGWAASVWFAASWGYWIVCEHVWGRTIGKRLLGIRVVGAGAEPPTWGRSLARNVLRLVDGIPFVVPYLLGFVVASADDDRRRLGDRAAGTRVVSG